MINLIKLTKNDLNSLENNLHQLLYLNTDLNDGVFNMLVDNYLLELLISGELDFPLLRIYGWSASTISLGINQSLTNIGNEIYSYPVVKRITGGQAVLHGFPSPNDELTYSLVFSSKDSAKNIYLKIGQVLLNFLLKYSLAGQYGYSDKNYVENFNCFNSKTSADIAVNDIKVIGSAQCRKKEFILQHGSIRLDIIRKLSGVKVESLNFNKAALDLKSSFEDTLNIKFLDYYLNDHIYEKIKQKSRSQSENINVENQSKQIYISRSK